MTSTNQLPVGTILQGNSYQYCITKVLGQGSFGITYLAEIKVAGALGSLNSNIKVCIKEFFMRDINGRETTQVTSTQSGTLFRNYKNKFTREALNLSRLNHPNIIKVIEQFEANNTAYYVMEYIDGGSLDSYINQRNGLDVDESLKITRQIGSALSFMHARGMLHLDLKPANVMMRSDGTAVLIDFGLSKQYNSEGEAESSTTVGAGTPGYAPIEQSNYQEGKGFPVTMDVYALGATLYKMLTGERPPVATDLFNDGFPLYSLQEHSINPRLTALLVKAMSPARVNRYQTVDLMLAELGEAVTGKPTAPRATSDTSTTTSTTTATRKTRTSSKQADDNSTRVMQDTDQTRLNFSTNDNTRLASSPSRTTRTSTTNTMETSVAEKSEANRRRPRSLSPYYVTGYNAGVAIGVFVALLVWSLFMLSVSRKPDPDADGRVLNWLFIILGLGVVCVLYFRRELIKTSIWKTIAYGSAILSFLNSALLPGWNGSLTASYFILSLVLAAISALTFTIKKNS